MIIEGKVVHGNKLGRVLGFPTANLEMNNDELEDVVSLCKVVIGDEVFDGLGTYLPRKGTYEVHILDFDRDIYGQHILVTLLKTFRYNYKFASQEELIEQIKNDVKIAREKLDLRI